MQAFLAQQQSRDLCAFFVWGPFLSGDHEQAARANSLRFGVPGGVHYWAPTPKVGIDLAGVLRLPQGKIAWDVYLAYGRGGFWGTEMPAPDYWQHQLPVLQGAPYNPADFAAHVSRLLSAGRQD